MRRDAGSDHADCESRAEREVEGTASPGRGAALIRADNGTSGETDLEPRSEWNRKSL